MALRGSCGAQILPDARKANKEIAGNPISSDTFTGGLITMEGQMSLTSPKHSSPPPPTQRNIILKRRLLEHNHTVNILSVEDTLCYYFRISVIIFFFSFSCSRCLSLNQKHAAAQYKHSKLRPLTEVGFLRLRPRKSRFDVTLRSVHGGLDAF